MTIPKVRGLYPFPLVLFSFGVFCKPGLDGATAVLSVIRNKEYLFWVWGNLGIFCMLYLFCFLFESNGIRNGKYNSCRANRLSLVELVPLEICDKMRTTFPGKANHTLSFLFR